MAPDAHEPMQVSETDVPIEETDPELTETLEPDTNENEVPPVECPLTFENELETLLKTHFP